MILCDSSQPLAEKRNWSSDTWCSPILPILLPLCPLSLSGILHLLSSYLLGYLGFVLFMGSSWIFPSPRSITRSTQPDFLWSNIKISPNPAQVSAQGRGLPWSIQLLNVNPKVWVYMRCLFFKCLKSIEETYISSKLAPPTTLEVNHSLGWDSRELIYLSL